MSSISVANRGRTLRHVASFALAALLAACGDYTSPDSPTPAAIAAVSGAGQFGTVGTTLASPLVFEVTSASDAPVSGVTVSFSVTTGSATLSVSSAVTDANGTASTQVTLGNVPGAVEVTATAQGGTLVARASATATQIASTDCTSTSTTLSLGQVITGLTGSSLCVGGGVAGGDFALVPFNASLDGSSSASLTVQARGVGASTVANLTPSAGSFTVLAGESVTSPTLASIALTRELDARLRASEARDLAPRIADARAWMKARDRTTSGVVPGLALGVIPSNVAIGSLVTLNANAESACSSPDLRTGRVAAVSNKAIIVADTENPASGFTTADCQSTVGHEYQHLINASRRMYVNTAATDFEETWLDEGLSHIAEELLFFAKTGLKPRANIDAALLRSSSAFVDAFNDEAISNFSRLGRYLGAPTSNSAFADNDELATRGATWSFLRYAADHTGSDDGTTWFQLVNSATTGIANLTQVFGANLTSLVRDWATSVFADDITTTDSRFQQSSWNLRSIYGALQSNGLYPLATTALTTSTPASVSVSSGSAAYLRFSVAAGQTAMLQWNTLPSNVQLILVRTR